MESQEIKLTMPCSVFLSRGGSIKKIDQVAGEPVMGKEYLLSEEMLEMVETEESDFF